MEHCNRPGCNGVIDDGYCTVCGLAPLAAGAAAPMAAAVASSSVSAPAVSASGRTASTVSTPSTRSTRSTRSTSSTSRRSSQLLGGGLIERAPLPPQDPLATLVPGEVPDRKRFCSNCGNHLTRDSGYCPKCGQEYSFKPSLQPGDMVAGKYEVKGTIAFGGLGWIYLALDTVLSRWVVLKGLLNSKDPNLITTAVKEREFLAAVKHRSIVGIYDFITSGREGFIVMEYVNGKTLMTLRQEYGGPLPAAEAISYIVDILPAFGYLADMGLVYCDFKPENAMVEGDNVKLIDMGAVRRVDDPEGAIYGSKGYSAPEANDGPTPVSDLYTVARTLAVLVARFDFQGKYEYSLPPAGDVPVFTEHESLYRFLLRATRTNPDERFQTAEEMVEQLLGVLREVALGTIDVSRVRSQLFDEGGDFHVEGGRLDSNVLDYRDLPALKPDPQDPVQGIVLAAAALTNPDRRKELFERALTTYPDSAELHLRIAAEQTDLGAFDDAEAGLVRLQAADGADWRPVWYRGRLLLAQGKAAEAGSAFQAVYDDLPGELAPKLGLAMAAEAAGDFDRAIHYYDLVSRSNPALTAAAFGLARCQERKGNCFAAAEAYERVPASSSQQPRAQMGLARVLLSRDSGPPSEEDLARAAAAIEGIRGTHDGLELHQISARLLLTAAEAIEAGAIPANAASRLLGVSVEPRPLRAGAERELRTCARFAPDRAARILYVDEANHVRPRTLV